MVSFEGKEKPVNANRELVDTVWCSSGQEYNIMAPTMRFNILDVRYCKHLEGSLGR
jgi:hypothetical protein